MRKEPNKDVPAWAIALLIAVVTLGVLMLCYLGLWHTALEHDTVLALLDLPWPRVRHGKGCLIGVLVLLILAVVTFTFCFEQPKRRISKALLNTFGAALLTVLTVGACCISYSAHLARQGIGTMQTALDTDYRQEDGKLVGNLGIYGGWLKPDDEAQIYVCRQIDSFGPFPEQILEDTAAQPFSEGYEQYSRFEQDGLVQLHAVSVYHYHDGYWLVVKRFVDIRDLRIELEALDDLQKYIVQMQYNRHTGDIGNLIRKFEEVAGEAVTRTQ